jgi:hypothetical protein
VARRLHFEAPIGITIYREHIKKDIERNTVIGLLVIIKNEYAYFTDNKQLRARCTRYKRKFLYKKVSQLPNKLNITLKVILKELRKEFKKRLGERLKVI